MLVVVTDMKMDVTLEFPLVVPLVSLKVVP